MQNKTCGSCVNFDQIVTRGRHGRCAAKSVYATQEQPGQTFPEGVKRAAPGEQAKPFIVTKLQIVVGCPSYRAL